MDFTLTEEQQMIVDSLGKYVGNELEPTVKEYRDRLIPKEKMLEIQQGLLDFGVGVGVVSEEAEPVVCAAPEEGAAGC